MEKNNRNYKDSVFTDLFYSDVNARNNLLSLYNALYGTFYTDPEIIQKLRLEDILFKNFKNDIAFLVGNRHFILGEHQSTLNPNMPLRFLMYIGREYESLITAEERYRKKLIYVPTPQFITFYNGEDDAPAETSMKLSDAYIQKDSRFSLELDVRVININTAKMHPLLEQCNVLKEYSLFIDTARKYKNEPDGLKKTVIECTNQGILTDYLNRKGKEVINMLLAEYDYEMDMRVQREEAKEELREEVIKEVHGQLFEKIQEQVREEVLNKLRQEVRTEVQDEVRDKLREEMRGEVQDEVRDKLREEMRGENIKIAVDLLKNAGLTENTIKKQIAEKYAIPEKEVERYL